MLLYFHGWGEDSTTFGEYQSWVNIAKEENYVVVVPEGIQNSWQFPGSSDGIGSDESSITTCDTRRSEPEYCYQGSCPCHTRCGWTQCRDDDLQFALDLIQDIPNQICGEFGHHSRQTIYMQGPKSRGGFVATYSGHLIRPSSLICFILQLTIRGSMPWGYPMELC